MILIDHISKSFDSGRTYAVRDLSLCAETGQTLVLLGSSGCGKTTTLKMVNRLVEADAGRIELGGQDVRTMNLLQLRRSVGYVFQGIGLFPHMTVAENVGAVLRLNGVGRAEREARAQAMLELVELDPDTFADRYPRHLSGGQQQRVGVARALAADPDYLLMDEPFGALDALTRETLQAEVLRLKAKLHKTILFVTHDIFEALALGDVVAVMHAGHLEQVGTPGELLRRPATAFVESLFGKPRSQLMAFAEHLQ